LLLCEIEERDNGGPFPVGRILQEESFDYFVVFCGKIEGSGIVIGLGGPMGKVSSGERVDILLKEGLRESLHYLFNQYQS
jgi:hypothetical protein